MAMLNRRMRGGGGMHPSMYNGAGTLTTTHVPYVKCIYI